MTILEDSTHEQRMLAWHDLRPSRARVCLRVVLGKQCIDGNARADRCGRVRRRACLCRTVQQMWRNLLDHVGIWLDADGRHVMTIEPYNAPPECVEELTERMAGLGITVTVGDRSPWYPGSTTLLLLTRSAS